MTHRRVQRELDEEQDARLVHLTIHGGVKVEDSIMLDVTNTIRFDRSAVRGVAAVLPTLLPILERALGTVIPFRVGEASEEQRRAWGLSDDQIREAVAAADAAAANAAAAAASAPIPIYAAPVAAPYAAPVAAPYVAPVAPAAPPL